MNDVIIALRIEISSQMTIFNSSYAGWKDKHLSIFNAYNAHIKPLIYQLDQDLKESFLYDAFDHPDKDRSYQDDVEAYMNALLSLDERLAIEA